jgi:hypothetical protein
LSKEFKDDLRGKFVDRPSYQYPETSDRGESNWGYVIATSTMDVENYSVFSGSVKENFSLLSMTDGVALFILHGMGHNSGISHKNIPRDLRSDLGFMAPGQELADFISKSNGDILALIKYTVQNHPDTITMMQNRFKQTNEP